MAKIHGFELEGLEHLGIELLFGQNVVSINDRNLMNNDIFSGDEYGNVQILGVKMTICTAAGQKCPQPSRKMSDLKPLRNLDYIINGVRALFFSNLSVFSKLCLRS